ncbi:MAG: MoaD/ThiS family protein [Nitrospiria bacterium]
MVTVKFFAVLKKLTGREDINIPISQSTTLRKVFDHIEMEIPQIRTILKEGRALVAVNQEMADEDSVVRDGDEIAMLPPFAGG